MSEKKAEYLTLENIRYRLELPKGEFAEKLGISGKNYAGHLKSESEGRANKTIKLLAVALLEIKRLEDENTI